MTPLDFLPYSLSALVTAALGIFAWTRRANASRILAAMAFAMTAHQLLRLVELTVADFEEKLLWDAVQWIPATAAAVAMFLFCVRYVGHKLRWPHLTLGAGLLAYSTVVVAVPALREGLFESPHLVPDRVDALVYDLTPTAYVIAAGVYTAILSGFALLYLHQRGAAARHRTQIRVTLVGMAVPMLTITLPLVGLNPFDQLDVSHIGYPIQTALMTYGYLRHRWLDVVPLALERVMDSIAEGLFVLDETGRIVHVNTAFAAMADRPTEQLLGARMEDVFPDEMGIVERFRGREVDREEVFLEHPERGPTWFDVSVRDVCDAQGRFVGRAVVIRDVTARHLSAQALATANDGLARANEELEAYARTVAHDLKGPLTGVLGHADLLRDEVPPDQRPLVEEIMRAGDSMHRIIQELLLLARLRNESELPLTAADAARIAGHAIERVSFLCQERGGRIELPDVPLPRVLTYPRWLEEVLANYLSNALKYGGDPPVARVYWEPAAGGRVTIGVADNGPGLTPAEQAELFTEFTRLSPDRAEGHGLGLAVVARIARRLQGEVGVTSEEGQGARFWIRMPLADAGQSSSSAA